MRLFGSNETMGERENRVGIWVESGKFQSETEQLSSAGWKHILDLVIKGKRTGSAKTLSLLN